MAGGVAARLGIGPPETWDWPYLLQQVSTHGVFRLFHLERRFVPTAGELARTHGMTLWVTPRCAVLRLVGDPAR